MDSPHVTVISAGTERTGDLVSTNMNIWVAVTAFPQSSATCQTRSIQKEQGGVKKPSRKVGVRLVEQLSTAVAKAGLGGGKTAPHSIVTSGGSIKTGFVVSTKWIAWSPAVSFPQASVARQVRVMIVSQFTTEGTSEKVIFTAGVQLSVAVAMPVF